MRSLDLSFNRLCALPPRCLAPLADNLRELKLYSNRLGFTSGGGGGLEGSGLAQCRNLERLELHDNGLCGVPAGLGPKLKASERSSGGGPAVAAARAPFSLVPVAFACGRGSAAHALGSTDSTLRLWHTSAYSVDSSSTRS